VKSKYFKYFLIAAVIGIWGTVILRVVDGLKAPKAPEAVRSAPVKNVRKLTEDTFTLYADYPDPFLSEVDSGADKTAIKKDPVAVPAASSPPPNFVTPEMVETIIQYKGLISNPKKKSRVAIVTIHGKEYLVREKDRLEGIRILKIGKTGITVLYKGGVFEISE
jgi:hypothetical protein